MTTVDQLRRAMNAITAQKGPFTLFGVIMRSDTPGRRDLVVAAPWLEAGKLKVAGELIRLLEEQLGEKELRRFANIVTLKASSPEIREELDALNIESVERRFFRTSLFGADVDEAVILRAKVGGRTTTPTAAPQPTSRARRTHPKSTKRERAARG